MYYTEDGKPRDRNAKRRDNYRERGYTGENKRGRKTSTYMPPMSDEHIAWCDVVDWMCLPEVSNERYQAAIQKCGTYIETAKYIKTLCPNCWEEKQDCVCEKPEPTFGELAANYEKLLASKKPEFPGNGRE